MVVLLLAFQYSRVLNFKIWYFNRFLPDIPHILHLVSTSAPHLTRLKIHAKQLYSAAVFPSRNIIFQTGKGASRGIPVPRNVKRVHLDLAT